MRKHSLNRYKLNDNKGIKKSLEVEEAVRRFKKRESEKVLPLMGKKAKAAAAAALLRSLSNRRRPLYLSRRIQRARLSSRRRFFYRGRFVPRRTRDEFSLAPIETR